MNRGTNRACFFEQKRILVCGGTGYIGSNLIAGLTALPVEVEITSFANVTPDSPYPGVRYEIGDLGDPQHIHDLLAQGDYDHIFNLAGFLNKTRDPAEESAVFNNHFLGTKNLIQALVGRKLTSFLHVGSAEEYGATPSPQQEDDRIEPISIYGLAKAMGTQYVLMQQAQTGFPCLVVRPFNVYGRQAKNGIIPYVLNQARQGKPIATTKGEQVRDFIHIDDLVTAMLELTRCQTQNPDRFNGQIFNICNGQGVLIRDVITQICKHYGVLDKVDFGAVPYREGEALEIIGAKGKLKEFTGYTPGLSLRQGLAGLLQDNPPTEG